MPFLEPHGVFFHRLGGVVVIKRACAAVPGRLFQGHQALLMQLNEERGQERCVCGDMAKREGGGERKSKGANEQ